MKNRSFITAYAIRTFLLFCFAAFTNTALAQCLVNSLIITTGTDNNGTPVGQGNNDPHWFCVNKTGVYAGTTPLTPANAFIVNPVGSWASGNWICDTQLHANPGIITTTAGTLTFERKFSLCHYDDVTFNLAIRADGGISDILVDGVSKSLSHAGNYSSGSSIWTPTFTQSLIAGIHTLRIVVTNPTPQTGSDPIGFFLNGTVTSVNASIINDQDPQCANYACARCDEECYWTVEGNNIINGSNIFGTLTDDNIRIVSNGNATPDRGVIAGGDAFTGGYLGWNTTAPTARLHVNCRDGNNPDNGMNQLSDIRFENLEPGGGYILAIDRHGYVYNTRVQIEGQESDDGTVSYREDVTTLKQELRELKMQLADLRRTIATGTPGLTDAANRNMLYQNAPNPFDKETVIKYHVVTMQRSAFIVVHDLSGRELAKYAAQQGEGAVNINANTMQPGTYLYSLVVDGREVETRSMILSR